MPGGYPPEHQHYYAQEPHYEQREMFDSREIKREGSSRERERDRDDRRDPRRDSDRRERRRHSRSPRRSRGSREREREGRDRDRDRERDRYRDRERVKEEAPERERESRERDRPKEDKRSRSRSKTPPHRKRVSLWDKEPSPYEIGLLPVPPHLANSRKARRIFVGNIPETVREKDLKDFFSDMMYMEGSSKDTNPSCATAANVNREGRFAFVEFCSFEDATAALRFDGVEFQGHKLQLRRPADYDAPEWDQFFDIPDMPPLSSGAGGEGPNKVFIGGLPTYLTDDQVKELVLTFGKIRSFNLVKDSVTGNSKGFAFFEYEDPEVTDRACEGLNGMKLGEKAILVQRSNAGASRPPPPPQNQDGTNPKPLLYNPLALNVINLQMPIPTAANLLNINLDDPGPPTRIVQLMNMVAPEDIWFEDTRDEIMEDLEEEVNKYGKVLSTYIARVPRRDYDEDGNVIPMKEIVWGLGRVFIEYETPEQARECVEAVAGKTFQGRQVIAGYFPEGRYLQRDLLPDPSEERAYFEKFRYQRKDDYKELKSDVPDIYVKE